jgi:hypothetical protein
MRGFAVDNCIALGDATVCAKGVPAMLLGVDVVLPIVWSGEPKALLPIVWSVEPKSCESSKEKLKADLSIVLVRE